MRRTRTVSTLAAVAVLTMLAGCAASAGNPTVPESPAVTEWHAYAGPWTLDQIIEFPSELRVVGTISAIANPRAATVDVGTLEWVAVTVDIETSTPDLKSKTFVARVIPAFESQAEVERLRVGDRILYLGDLPVEADGVAAGTSSWIIKIAPDGSLVSTNDLDSIERGTLVEVAEALRLDIEALDLTAPSSGG